MACVLLIDNGSKRPEATLQLRQLADALGKKAGMDIHPVSLRHADSIDAAELNGELAVVFNEFLQQQLASGQREFIVLPLFFGESRALTSWIPDQVDVLKEKHGDFTLTVADVLYPLPDGEPLLATILYEHILETASSNDLPFENMVLVDHGSPTQQVTQVRQSLANEVQALLGGQAVLDQAVMERREGQQYDFNGELLEDWLIARAEQGATSAIVALLLLLPGRHAGTDGDIETICHRVMKRYPAFQIVITPLITAHSSLLVILAERLRTILKNT